MFIRVQYPTVGKDIAPAHTYECKDFYQSWGEDPKSGCTECTPCSYIMLVIDGGKHEVRLGAGCYAYIMNNEGKTIDKIVV